MTRTQRIQSDILCYRTTLEALRLLPHLQHLHVVAEDYPPAISHQIVPSFKLQASSLGLTDLPLIFTAFLNISSITQFPNLHLHLTPFPLFGYETQYAKVTPGNHNQCSSPSDVSQSA